MKMITFKPQNMILFSVFYHILMFIGDPILLSGFKLGDGVLGLSVLGDVFFGNIVDADFILDDIHE